VPRFFNQVYRSYQGLSVDGFLFSVVSYQLSVDN